MGVLAAEAVSVLRAPLVTNRYGAQIRDWPNATQTTVPGVSIQPVSATEDAQGRELRITGYRLFTARGRNIDLLATDRVRWAGLVLQVDGEVARWPAPGGGVHHVEAVLRLIEG